MLTKATDWGYAIARLNHKAGYIAFAPVNEEFRYAQGEERTLLQGATLGTEEFIEGCYAVTDIEKVKDRLDELGFKVTAGARKLLDALHGEGYLDSSHFDESDMLEMETTTLEEMIWEGVEPDNMLDFICPDCDLQQPGKYQGTNGKCASCNGSTHVPDHPKMRVK